MTFYNFQNMLRWRLIRHHLCTFAVALSFGSSWRAPRDAFRYGGVTSALAMTVAATTVALPAALLQLAVGQLSQQDAVGIWKAVPFFKGVGYIRLLISFIGALWTVVYVAISTTYIFQTLTDTFSSSKCSEYLDTPEDDLIVYNVTCCGNEAFLPAIGEQPEYYIALAFIIIVLWILFPFILYNPVKLMKKLFYGFGFMVLLLGIIIVSVIGHNGHLARLINDSDWINFERPNIWHSALVQALLSNQLAGGYLISSGDTIYANTNVQWTALSFVGANVLACWIGILFWYAFGGDVAKTTNTLAVINHICKVSIERNLNVVWPSLLFAMLSFSGMITMLSFLYPLYDRFRRVGGHNWRYVSVGSSVVSAVAAFVIITIGDSVLSLLEDVIVPCLVSIATVLEISAFICIYGWRVLVEDIEFLLGSKLPKCWVWGWCTAIVIIVIFTLWWIVDCFLDKSQWTEAPWEATGILTSISAALAMFLVYAAVSVAKQDHYDFMGKLKSSFKPSRHWGPRDPITHHYWLARREEGDRNASNVRFHRRQLGQLSGFTNPVHIFRLQMTEEESLSKNKRHPDSDDLLVICRRNHIAKLNKNYIQSRKRSKSLDWDAKPKIKLQNKYHNLLDSLTSIDFKYSEQEKNIIKSDLE